VEAAPNAATRARTGADFSLRLRAFLVDYIVCVAVMMVAVWVASLVARPLTLEAILTSALGGLGLTTLLNQLLLAALRGQTLGKMLLAIKIVRLDGTRPGFWQVVRRHLVGYPVSTLPLGLGFLWAGWDADRMAWHDKLSLTTVVRVEQ
jgi:uncharacterized RDD family membrane protein YckC